MPEMKFGAIHDPDSVDLAHAADYAAIKVGSVAGDTNWFEKWNWRADGNALGNDDWGCCVPAGDFRLVQGWMAALGVVWAIPRELVLNRYSMTGGFQGTAATDVGTITQFDAFSWQTGPILVSGIKYPVKWSTVAPADVFSALRRGPLLGTIGLSGRPDGQNTYGWQNPAPGDFDTLHRVVFGASKGGKLVCRTYGYDRLVDPSRVVAADLMMLVDAPEPLKTAGIDWRAVA
jgi:hypothetical protein